MTEAEFWAAVVLRLDVLILWVRVGAVACGLGLGVLLGSVVWRFFGEGPLQRW